MPTLASLLVIVFVLALVTVTSLYATRRGGDPAGSAHLAHLGTDTHGGQDTERRQPPAH